MFDKLKEENKEEDENSKKMTWRKEKLQLLNFVVGKRMNGGPYVRERK